MQNTTSSNENANKLIENFFMAGLNQDTIIREFRKENKEKITPEILFSMYSNENAMNNYLQFIFPHKIRLATHAEKPKFHTFECKDEKGNDSFFHCLKFQEELD